MIPPEFAFLSHVRRGVIHVGANIGQERYYYGEHDLPVVWLEPLPDIFRELEANLAGYPKQRAYRRLITDKTGDVHTLHKQRNKLKMSTSIFPFSGHKRLFPNIKHRDTLEGVPSITLSAFMREEQLDPRNYDALVIDTEGAELLVLQGAGAMLCRFTYILVEAGDIEIYSGGCTLAQLSEHLRDFDFVEVGRYPFAAKAWVGAMYNVLFQWRDPHA